MLLLVLVLVLLVLTISVRGYCFWVLGVPIGRVLLSGHIEYTVFVASIASPEPRLWSLSLPLCVLPARLALPAPPLVPLLPQPRAAAVVPVPIPSLKAANRVAHSHLLRRRVITVIRLVIRLADVSYRFGAVPLLLVVQCPPPGSSEELPSEVRVTPLCQPVSHHRFLSILWLVFLVLLAWRVLLRRRQLPPRGRRANREVEPVAAFGPPFAGIAAAACWTCSSSIRSSSFRTAVC